MLQINYLKETIFLKINNCLQEKILYVMNSYDRMKQCGMEYDKKTWSLV